MINIFLCKVLHILISKLRNHSLNLLCRDKRCLNSNWKLSRWIHIEHISFPNKIFRPFTTKDCSTIHLRNHSKSNSRWNVCLDQSSNHIHWWPLRCQDEMNSYRSSLRSQTVNTVFNLLSICRTRKHHISHLINDKDNTIHFLLSLRLHFLIVFIKISNSLVF